MTQAHNVTIALTLPEDRTLDVFLFQWHTSLAGLEPLDQELVAKRRTCLESFSDWWLSDFDGHQPRRPCLLLLPELSLPLTLVPTIDALVATAARSMVVVAGVEFLTWKSYLDVLATLAMPNPAVWGQGGGDYLRVNSALIWIKDDHGLVRKFVQPKRVPSNPEDPNVFRCDHVLLFRSDQQTSGSHFNFCVQICSDFTSVEAVRGFRQACEAAAPATVLDFAFVLQMNEDQDALQFGQGVDAYFAPPDNMVVTTQGCLVFVNTANPKSGKSRAWGRSALHFEFSNRWRLGHPLHTCALIDKGPLNHQAAVFRESGPAIYWFQYKPHYLVSRKPGAGQATPFVANSGRCCPVPDDLFSPDRFTPLLPVSYWLSCEWGEGEKELGAVLSELGVPQGVVDDAQRSYLISAGEWNDTLGKDDDIASRAVRTYFEAHERENYPSKQVEPTLWCEGASRGAKNFQWFFGLLGYAAGVDPTFTISVDPGQVRHARRSDEISLSLLWGGGERTSRQLIGTYLNALTTRGAADELASRLVLIVVQPLGVLAGDELTTLINQLHQDITKAEPAPLCAAHLAQDGEIVNPLADQQLVCLSDASLFAAIDGATSPEDLKNRVRSALEAAFI